MPQMGRPGLSPQQKAELWARWKAGQSLSDIGRALGKHAASVFGVLLAKGGIAPLARNDHPERAWREASRPKPCLLAANRYTNILATRRFEFDFIQTSEHLTPTPAFALSPPSNTFPPFQ